MFDVQSVSNVIGSTFTNQAQEDFLINEKAVAKWLAVGLSTVQQWRLKGQGPRFIKIGKSVRYRQSDVLAYIREQESFSSTSEADMRKSS